ncbi:sorting nexin-16-like [Hydractinia symbiolongicarpus]|uniref:sorting nexin-16-like n=1 Tax=Hydractinia symbiolongicarpus TaxID=13093 RepID=UPI00254B6063|nr:sorting nexin-16-like [Hydractinia symbiolongicarpus]
MGKRNSKIKWDYDSSTECLTDQSKNYYEEVFSPQSSTGVCAPIVGYEILKKRKTYSVYKLHVIVGGNSWFVYRTYKDFFLLHRKLCKEFPSFCVKLPKKKKFGSKFSKDYLQCMRRELQIYFEVLMQHDSISNSDVIKDFLRLLDPPGPYESIDQSRTFCEELQQSVTCLGDKIKELERELKMSNYKLTEAIVRQKHLEMKLAEEKERTAKLVVDKNDLEKRIVVFPELTEVKNFERNEASIYS